MYARGNANYCFITGRATVNTHTNTHTDIYIYIYNNTELYTLYTTLQLIVIGKQEQK